MVDGPGRPHHGSGIASFVHSETGRFPTPLVHGHDPVDMQLPHDCLSLLGRQHGVISRQQLVHSVHERRVDTLVRRGRLVPVERGVYRTIGGATTREQAAMAALLRARPAARLTGPFVLGLFDVDGFSVDDDFEVLTAPGRDLRGVSFSHRSDPCPSDPPATMRGLHITSPATALIDSWRHAEELGERRLHVAYDQMRWRALLDARRVRDRAERLGPEDPGAVGLLAWLDDGNEAPESEGERLLGALLAGFDPAPEPQVHVLSYRIDWYWRRYRLGVEYQGDIDHASAAARLADTARFRDLAQAGVAILPVVRGDISDRTHFLAWVHAQLVVRAHELDVALPGRR